MVQCRAESEQGTRRTCFPRAAPSGTARRPPAGSRADRAGAPSRALVTGQVRAPWVPGEGGRAPAEGFYPVPGPPRACGFVDGWVSGIPLRREVVPSREELMSSRGRVGRGGGVRGAPLCQGRASPSRVPCGADPADSWEVWLHFVQHPAACPPGSMRGRGRSPLRPGSFPGSGGPPEARVPSV